MIESSEKFFARGAGFLDDWVFPHGDHRSIFTNRQPFSCQFDVADRHLRGHDFGAEEIVFGPPVHPPFAREFLISQDNNVSTQMANEVADDTRLDVNARLQPLTVTDSKAPGKIRSYQKPICSESAVNASAQPRREAASAAAPWAANSPRRRSVGSANSADRSQRFSSSTDIWAIVELTSSRTARTV